MDKAQHEPALVDFTVIPRRLQSVAGVVGGLALLGCVVDGALNGLTFALMGRWAGIFIVGMVAGMAVLTALHAFGGASRAARQGQRLALHDVGLSPRRLNVVPPPQGGEGEGGDPATDPASPEAPRDG